jgi:phosphatidylserine/phosphatidylglycerophosphate/cardiolipin synthase-like enzyme
MQGTHDLRHSHTYVSGVSTTRTDLVDLIDRASERVLIASYLIGDGALSDALERAAVRLRGGVHVIVNLHGGAFADNVHEAAERMRFECLSARGVMIRGYPGCHAKFAVIDDQAAFVHSANFMTRAFDVTGENGVVIFDQREVAEAARFFEVLWHGASWEMETTGDRVVSRRHPDPLPRHLRADPPEVGLIWTFNEAHLILGAITELISTAERELIQATFNVSEMSRRPELLHDHLRDAVARGVAVRLLMRARSGQDAGAEAAALSDIGVKLYPCSLNHAKGVVADRVRGALFSANLDARFGLDTNVELGVRLDRTPALAEALRFLEHSMAEHDRDFVRDPDARTLASGWASPRLPAGEQVEVDSSHADWKRLSDLRSGPVIFEQEPDCLSIFAEYQSWRLNPHPAGQSYILELGPPQEDHAMSRLLQGDNRTCGSTVGICTAIIRLRHQT